MGAHRVVGVDDAMAGGGAVAAPDVCVAQHSNCGPTGGAPAQGRDGRECMTGDGRMNLKGGSSTGHVGFVAFDLVFFRMQNEARPSEWK